MEFRDLRDERMGHARLHTTRLRPGYINADGVFIELEAVTGDAVMTDYFLRAAGNRVRDRS